MGSTHLLTGNDCTQLCPWKAIPRYKKLRLQVYPCLPEKWSVSVYGSGPEEDDLHVELAQNWLHFSICACQNTWQHSHTETRGLQSLFLTAEDSAGWLVHV